MTNAEKLINDLLHNIAKNASGIDSPEDAMVAEIGTALFERQREVLSTAMQEVDGFTSMNANNVTIRTMLHVVAASTLQAFTMYRLLGFDESFIDGAVDALTKDLVSNLNRSQVASREAFKDPEAHGFTKKQF